MNLNRLTSPHRFRLPTQFNCGAPLATAGNGPSGLSLKLRLLSTAQTPPPGTASGGTPPGSSTTASTPPAPPTPPPQTPPHAPAPPPFRQSRWRSFLTNLGRTTLVTLLAGSGALWYYTYKERNPPDQLPFDDSKKNLVVLGSGWAATSLLKNLDTADYNVTVISPKNYFLFTPLLPSVAVGTLNPRSIIQSTRYVTRHKSRMVNVIEAEAQDIDPEAKTVTFQDTSEIRGVTSTKTLPYDILVFAVGAEVQTFGIPGVQEHACFMKELADAERMQRVFMDCVETAAFPGQSREEIDRLLHIIVVGGGPTGIEVSGELHDFLTEDLRAWYPSSLSNSIKITLIEALPNVLPSFSKQLIEYTEKSFKEDKIEVLTGTMVKEVTDKVVKVQKGDEKREIPYGTLVWAGGNKGREVTRKLMAKFPETQTNKRGLTVDNHLHLLVPESSASHNAIFALGDCTASQYAPTAQVAAQEGAYLARELTLLAKADKLAEKLEATKSELVSTTDEGKKREVESEVGRLQKQYEKARAVRPFHYSHQGSLAYLGSEKAVADLPFLNGNLATGGVATYLFWRSAYLTMLFSLRNRVLVATDWLKVKLFGRDVSRD